MHPALRARDRYRSRSPWGEACGREPVTTESLSPRAGDIQVSESDRSCLVSASLDTTPMTFMSAAPARLAATGILAIGLSGGIATVGASTASAAPVAPAAASVATVTKTATNRSTASVRTGLSARQAASVVRIAASKRGTPYRYGASGPSRFDCSGLTASARASRAPRTSSTARARRSARARLAPATSSSTGAATRPTSASTPATARCGTRRAPATSSSSPRSAAARPTVGFADLSTAHTSVRTDCSGPLRLGRSSRRVRADDHTVKETR